MNEKVIDIQQIRNEHLVYHDRCDGGQILADLLIDYDGCANGIVLAIPSGGIPVGLEIANRLDLPMDLLITRKLQIPGNTEAGFGAVTLGGKTFFNEELLARLHLDQTQINREVETVRLELDRRNTQFRKSRPAPDLSNRTVIIVDDGIASGYTMIAAVNMVHDCAPEKIIVAIPTAPLSSIHRLENLVDWIFCPNIHDFGSFAVAAAYEKWRDLPPEEITEMLDQSNRLG